MKSKSKAVLVTNSGFEELTAFVAKLGKVSQRMSCRAVVLEHAISKLTESDVPKIMDRLYTAKDRFDELLERMNSERPDKPLTQGDLLQTLVENFNEASRSKKPKTEKVS